MKALRLPFFALIFLTLGGPGLVDASSSLYTLSVPVTDQTQVTRSIAFKTGINELLQRLVGRKFLLAEKPKLQKSLQNPESFIKGYRYESTKEGLFLHMRFNRVAMLDVLNDAHIPIWSEERPTTLIWLVVQRQSKKYLITPDQQDNWLQSMQHTGERYGVPILFPIWDLTDQEKISFADIWNMHSDLLYRASHRYGVNSILLGRIQQNGDNTYSGQWHYSLDGQYYDLTLNAVSEEEILSAAISLIANIQSQQMAVSTVGGVKSAILHVYNIHSFSDYKELMDYVQNLTPVKQTQLLSLNNRYLSLKIFFDDDLHKLIKLITIKNLLLPEVIKQTQMTDSQSWSHYSTEEKEYLDSKGQAEDILRLRWHKLNLK